MYVQFTAARCVYRSWWSVFFFYLNLTVSQRTFWIQQYIFKLWRHQICFHKHRNMGLFTAFWNSCKFIWFWLPCNYFFTVAETGLGEVLYVNMLYHRRYRTSFPAFFKERLVSFHKYRHSTCMNHETSMGWSGEPVGPDLEKGYVICPHLHPNRNQTINIMTKKTPRARCGGGEGFFTPPTSWGCWHSDLGVKGWGDCFPQNGGHFNKHNGFHSSLSSLAVGSSSSEEDGTRWHLSFVLPFSSMSIARWQRWGGWESNCVFVHCIRL